jgi:hypothetical protein
MLGAGDRNQPVVSLTRNDDFATEPNTRTRAATLAPWVAAHHFSPSPAGEASYGKSQSVSAWVCLPAVTVAIPRHSPLVSA